MGIVSVYATPLQRTLKRAMTRTSQSTGESTVFVVSFYLFRKRDNLFVKQKLTLAVKESKAMLHIVINSSFSMLESAFSDSVFDVYYLPGFW